MADISARRVQRVKQTNKAKQHSTPKAVTFPRKDELPRVGLEPTTLYTLDRACIYIYNGCVHFTINACVYTLYSYLQYTCTHTHIQAHTHTHTHTHNYRVGPDNCHCTCICIPPLMSYVLCGVSNCTCCIHVNGEQGKCTCTCGMNEA